MINVNSRKNKPEEVTQLSIKLFRPKCIVNNVILHKTIQSIFRIVAWEVWRFKKTIWERNPSPPHPPPDTHTSKKEKKNHNWKKWNPSQKNKKFYLYVNLIRYSNGNNLSIQVSWWIFIYETDMMNFDP